MSQVKHISIDTPDEEVLRIIDEDAAVIIDEVIPESEIDQILKELDPYIEGNLKGADEFTGFETSRVGALIARSRGCRDLAMHNKINSLASEFLEPHCENYQLHFTSLINIGPGETKQILHRDRGLWGGYISRKIETQFAVVWAASDFTYENGATQLVPGSHKWDAKREPMEDEITYAEMKKGSVLLYTGSVLHGGGDNTSEDIRSGIFMHFAPGWIRQQENQYLSCPPEIAKDLSPELRSLIGYSKGGYVMGFYSDPKNTDGTLESVTPEKIFSNTKDKYTVLASPEDLVKESTKEKK
ncbi:MAG: mitomycin antibiotic biosynthesis protein [Gammaproteobacteria bacterium]|nr:mitomycin antibiotic biosynthesis protein [Gammaproteobacteria bacterium]HJL96285.1 phytanoyl-CoA dioxygenase family protein [SAR86 cluster bacterium]|tara:strand:- start:21949 stop:22845 length:897 start_codon:yes stop_codon:yes gene_type:complete